MPAIGGKRAGAGRKKGIPNKTNKIERELVAATGQTPLQYFVEIYRNPKIPKARRDYAASQALPYCHSRLQAVTHSGDPTKPLVMVHRGMTPQEAAQAYQDTLKG